MIKVLELFAGIGACSKALTNIGIDIEIVDAVENNKRTIECFNKIHKTNFKKQDITNWNKDIEIDLLFHCTSLTDRNLENIIEKFVKNRPKYVLWETNKLILKYQNKHILERYYQEFNKYGYTTTHQILNAKDFRVPQNRERVYVISFLYLTDYKHFSWTKVDAHKQQMRPLRRFLFDAVDQKYYLDKEVKEAKHFKNFVSIPNRDGSLNNNAFNRYWKTDRNDCFIGTLSDITRTKVTINNKYRILTPCEYMLLMGYTIEDYDAIKDKSDSLIYKVSGNSIVVDVLKAIFKTMFCCNYCMGNE